MPTETDPIVDDYIAEKGAIVSFTGEMFSGKTEGLIDLRKEMRLRSKINPAVHYRKELLFFKALEDRRYSEDEVVNHDGTKRINAIKIRKSDPNKISHIVNQNESDGKKIGAVFIDEAWLFNEIILEICQQLADKNKIVALSLLSTFFNRKPVPMTGKLLCISKYIIQKHAFCISCKDRSWYSFRISQLWKHYQNDSQNPSEENEQLGGSKYYCALCADCFKKINELIDRKIPPIDIIKAMNMYEYCIRKEVI